MITREYETKWGPVMVTRNPEECWIKIYNPKLKRYLRLSDQWILDRYGDIEEAILEQSEILFV